MIPWNKVGYDYYKENDDDDDDYKDNDNDEDNNDDDHKIVSGRDDIQWQTRLK